MGKKSTTVETGLGDQQYNTITNNQSNIAASVDTGFAEAAATGETLVQGQNTITSNQSTLADNQQTMTDNQGTIIGNQNALSEGQSNISAQIAAIPQTQVVSQTVDTSGIENRIGTLEGTTQAGFDTMGTRFDTVDTSLAGISADTAGLGTKVDDLGTAVGTGFEGVNENLTAAQTDRDELKEAVLSGQVTMTDLINQYGENGALYYEQLAKGQADMIQQQAGLQTGLQSFRDDFGDYSTQMAGQVGDLGQQMVQGFGDVRTGQTNLSSAVSGVKDSVAEGAAPSAAVAGQGIGPSAQAVEIDYARIAKEVSVGANTANTESFSNGEMFSQKLDTIRQLIAANGQNMDRRMVDQYQKLTNSFDESGRLISSQVDQNGNQMARAIDQQGNLLMAAFDATGQRIMQDSLNINRMMAAFDRVSFRGGGNYRMGRLSPARRRRGGGLMDQPYSMSFG